MYNVVIARYSSKFNAVAERRVLTGLSPDNALSYLNKNSHKPLMIYAPSMVNTDAFFVTCVETDAYKNEYNKIYDK